MALIISLSEKFSNSSLPTIDPKLTAGLVAMWRFTDDQAKSLVDLSGNNHQLTISGTPEFTATGVRGGIGKGYLQTDIPDNVEHTLVCVGRLMSDVPGRKYSAFMGSHMNGTYYGIANAANGTALYSVHSVTEETDDNTLGVLSDVTVGMYASRRRTDTNVLSNGNVQARIRTNYERMQRHAFYAGSVSKKNNRGRGLCANPYYLTQDSRNDVANNTLSYDRVVTGGNFRILALGDKWIADNTPFGAQVVEVTEVMIYNRELTLTELDMIYNYSKTYHSKVLGLEI